MSEDRKHDSNYPRGERGLPKISRIRAILRNTLGRKRTRGTLSTEDLKLAFSDGRGDGFKGEDGYYNVTGSNLSEGNLTRITTTPDGKTLWYPTKIVDLEAAVATSLKEIDRMAFLDIMSNIQEIKAHKADGVMVDIEELILQRKEELAKGYQLIDFGSGDGRMTLVAAAYGLPSVGIEIDEEMLEMAKANLDKATGEGLLRAPAQMVNANFFDEPFLQGILNREGVVNSICYLYITPYTWQLVPLLLPHLKPRDIIVTYKEKLSDNAQFEQVKDRFERINQYWFGEPPVSSYVLR